MVLKGRKIRFNKDEAQKQSSEDIHTDIDEVIDNNRSIRSPVMTQRQTEMDVNSFIGKAIMKKRDTVETEKRQLNNIKECLQQHVDELEALNYIASGEPQMAVVDVLEMVNDFRKEYLGKSVDDAFTKMEQTILESTIESYQAK